MLTEANGRQVAAVPLEGVAEAKPWVQMHWHGVLRGIFTAELAGVEMHSSPSATLIAGVGIEGDRYATRRGHYSHLAHDDRQLTLIESEVLDAIRRETGITLTEQESRRNLITHGVPLNDLVGYFFHIGATVIYGGRLNVPCRYLERLIDKPVFEPLIDRAGLNCQIIRGGVIRVGDSIEPASAQETLVLARERP
jgi:MOSC domain-containing protein YiiM